MSTSHTRWSPAAVTVFESVFRPWMRRRLAGIHLAGLPSNLPEGRAVIMAANHVGWWDAFVLRELQRTCAPTAPLLTLMREGKLSRFPFFRWMGGVGIGESPGSLRQALRVAQTATAARPWVSIFPQGRLAPSWQRPMHFRRGVVAFTRALAPAVVLPVGIHYELLDKPCPYAFACAEEPIEPGPGEALRVEALEQSVADALGRIYQHLNTFGEEAPRRWPRSRFRSLPDPMRRQIAGASYEA